MSGNGRLTLLCKCDILALASLRYLKEGGSATGRSALRR
jgi:hypothetical protein